MTRCCCAPLAEVTSRVCLGDPLQRVIEVLGEGGGREGEGKERRGIKGEKEKEREGEGREGEEEKGKKGREGTG